MSNPPEPRFSTTIPSIHDDTTLNIRIYHPAILTQPLASSPVINNTRWQKKGIVMAHPYAPLGGSYDDRVVGIVLEEFLRAGWIVGTFNFRGAYGSKGRTSWSAKPELEDYKSFAGFFLHYLSDLRPDPPPDTIPSPAQSPISQNAEQLDSNAYGVLEDESPIVVLGGYSYGSLILKNLPPIPSILQPFASPPIGSAAKEILLRAHKLADQVNLEWINQARDHERRKRRGHEAKLSITMGGEETSPEQRRSSREIRRSTEGGRSADFGNRLRSLSLSHRKRNADNAATVAPPVPPVPTSVVVPRVRYLLVSPVTTPASALVVPGLAHGFWNRNSSSEVRDAYAKHETLVLYGDQDMFISVKKMEEWVHSLQGDSIPRVHSVKIAGAGHFWHEDGVEGELRSALRSWETRIRNGGID